MRLANGDPGLPLLVAKKLVSERPHVTLATTVVQILVELSLGECYIL